MAPSLHAYARQPLTHLFSSLDLSMACQAPHMYVVNTSTDTSTSSSVPPANSHPPAIPLPGFGR